MDWRKLVEAGEWGKITLGKVHPSERPEFYELLLKEVPTVERGDGVEKYLDHITPSEATTEQDRRKALLLQHVRIGKPAPDSPLGVIRQAVDDAKNSVLEETGITFHGRMEVFVYRNGKGDLVTLHPNIQKALDKRRKRLADAFFAAQEPERHKKRSEYDRWHELHPWRRAGSVFAWQAEGAFGYQTPVDHALSILRHAGPLRDFIRRATKPKDPRRTEETPSTIPPEWATLAGR